MKERMVIDETILRYVTEVKLIPWRKQQAEHPKSIIELLRSDMGGLVFQPITGLHKDVAEIVDPFPSFQLNGTVICSTGQPSRVQARLDK